MYLCLHLVIIDWLVGLMTWCSSPVWREQLFSFYQQSDLSISLLMPTWDWWCTFLFISQQRAVLWILKLPAIMCLPQSAVNSYHIQSGLFPCDTEPLESKWKNLRFSGSLFHLMPAAKLKTHQTPWFTHSWLTLGWFVCLFVCLLPHLLFSANCPV